MKYRWKTLTVDAEQFKLGQKSLPDGIVPVWVLSSKPEVVIGAYIEGVTPRTPCNMAFGCKTLTGWAVVQHGDWAVTLEDGMKLLLSDAQFREIFEEVLVESPNS